MPGEKACSTARAGKALLWPRIPAWRSKRSAESGEPGVLSARYSGPQATDEKNNRKVLERMKDVPEERRKARFVSCLVLSRKGEVIREIKEFVEGRIAFEKKGTQGFGYDPLFYYPPLEKTFAELLPEEKNQVSHRGRALKKLKEFLLRYLGSGL